MNVADELPGWRPGAARDAIVDFIGQTEHLPVAAKVAVFDNDGTLWCEKPNYTQLDFFMAQLQQAADRRPELLKRPEYAALLAGDQAALADFALVEIALALVELLAGLTPDEFAERARDFVMTRQHPGLARPYSSSIYQPMLELMSCLRGHGFTVCIVSGGGTEFVRAVSQDLYGVEPERVVGTLVTYQFQRRNGSPMLVRSSTPWGAANEGAEKVTNIQFHLGRRPILAGGNSAGDTEMLEYAMGSLACQGLALLIDHDDGEREFAYASEAGTFAGHEPIRATADRLGWTVVSMKDDWRYILPMADRQYP